MKKAHRESQNGAFVVLLIPVRTETQYWHDFVFGHEIRFVRTRLKFIDGSGSRKKRKGSATFGSAVVIMRPGASLSPEFERRRKRDTLILPKVCSQNMELN